MAVTSTQDHDTPHHHRRTRRRNGAAATSGASSPDRSSAASSGAVVLVTLPFAGAREHVITGSVLLDVRRLVVRAGHAVGATDGPAAAVGAGAGCVHGRSRAMAVLATAPTGNELGWVWPPVVMALAVWMTVHARRELHSRTRLWIVYPICVALGLSSIGGAYETYREATDDMPMAGRLVDVGGHKLHIDCTRRGQPNCRARTRTGRTVRRHGVDRSRRCRQPRGSACTTAPVAGGASRPTAPQDGVEVATDLAHSPRTRRRTRAVRARRALGRRHLRHELRAPLPRADRRRRPARLDAPRPVLEDRFVARLLRDVPPDSRRCFPRSPASVSGDSCTEPATADLPPKARDAARAFNGDSAWRAQRARRVLEAAHRDGTGEAPKEPGRPAPLRHDREEGRTKRLDVRAGRARCAVHEQRPPRAAERLPRDAHRRPCDRGSVESSNRRSCRSSPGRNDPHHEGELTMNAKTLVRGLIAGVSISIVLAARRTHHRRCPRVVADEPSHSVTPPPAHGHLRGRRAHGGVGESRLGHPRLVPRPAGHRQWHPHLSQPTKSSPPTDCPPTCCNEQSRELPSTPRPHRRHDPVLRSCSCRGGACPWRCPPRSRRTSRATATSS